MPRLLQYSDIENVFDVPARAARLAGRIRALDGPDALVVASGDTTAPGVLSLVATGRQTIDFYAATETAFDTLGNHEFDYGPDALRGLIEAAPTQFLSANVRDEAGDRFGHEAGVVPWTTREIDGSTVGFVGVTDPATDSLNPMAAPLAFDDPIAAVRAAFTEMEDEASPPAYRVVLSHLGGGDDALARAVDADVILGGHVHSRRLDWVDDTLIVRPGVNGESVVEVELDAGDATATHHEPDGAEPHGPLQAALTERMSAADLDEVVGTVADPIRRDSETVHGGECRIGNFVADAFRWAHDADVGLSNAGGLREGDPWAGAVTKADLISLIPFEEPVVVTAVTGSELRSVLHEMAAPDIDFGEDDWWHGHVSNASVVWDDAQETLVEATVGGEAIVPDAEYTIATSAYLLHSDHEFPTLSARHRIGEGAIQYEVLAAFARERGIDPRVEGRVEIITGR